MGYTTDFIGHLDVFPALNHAEQQYLTAFSESRRCRRPGGPYEVPGNPAAEHGERPTDIDAYNDLADGQPSLWCDWLPCWDGCCLSHNGREKFYNSTRWMQYLIDHFLAEGAHASRSGLAYFDDFTFDHMLNGVIAGCRRDTRELFLIEVDNNVISERLLYAPSLSPDVLGELARLPYEEELDEVADARVRRRR